MNGKIVFGLIELALAAFVIYVLVARPKWFRAMLPTPKSHRDDDRKLTRGEASDVDKERDR